MKCTHLTSSMAVLVISFVILFSDKRTFAAASQKIKTNEGTVYEHDRQIMCQLTPWRVETLLYEFCVKKRKRILADEDILESPEKARSFLRKSTREVVTNYALFMEECCAEGCRTNEILEHCVASY